MFDIAFLLVGVVFIIFYALTEVAIAIGRLLIYVIVMICRALSKNAVS